MLIILAIVLCKVKKELFNSNRRDLLILIKGVKKTQREVSIFSKCEKSVKKIVFV